MIALPRSWLAPPWLAPPWLDRKGRISPLRSWTLVVLVAPGAWDVFAWFTGRLGARATHEALHQAGLWAIWCLMASLAITPAKAVLGMPGIVVLRRMVGLTALWYGLIHVVLYAADEHWNVLFVLGEIVLRFYLEIGFVALAILAILGWTSRDKARRKLGADTWKRLHRAAYAVGILATLHYFLQTKADVSQAVIVGGVFIWLMLWRTLPAGRDRGPLAMFGLAFASGALTLALEWAWYRLATNVDPMRVLRGELDVSFGLQPAGQVLALGLLAALAVELRRISLTRHADRMWASMLVYAGGATLAGLGIIAVGWTDLTVDDPALWTKAAVWVAAVGLMGTARFYLRELPGRFWVDTLWVACLLYPVFISWFDSPSFGLTADAVVIAAALLLAARIWSASRASALLLVPLIAWVGYSAAASF